MLSLNCTHHHPTVIIASRWIDATMESVLSWNNKTRKGSGSLALFSAASLKARMEGTKSLEHP